MSSLSQAQSTPVLCRVISVSAPLMRSLSCTPHTGILPRAVFLIGLSELRDEGTDGLGLKEHPGADADAFDLTVMEPSPEGRTGDPQGSQGLLYGEQPL